MTTYPKRYMIVAYYNGYGKGFNFSFYKLDHTSGGYPFWSPYSGEYFSTMEEAQEVYDKMFKFYRYMIEEPDVRDAHIVEVSYTRCSLPKGEQ